LLPLIVESGVAAIANPLINITLQGRHDTYPKRRGMTRAPELIAAGVTVAFGHDCVMDPWYSFGAADMLDVAHMAIHVGQMTSLDGIAAAYDGITTNAAKILHLDGYGVEPGCRADLIVLQAADPFEAIRLKAARLLVLRAGKVIARSAARVSELSLPQRPQALTLEFAPGSV
jgi:cytosine deaminase